MRVFTCTREVAAVPWADDGLRQAVLHELERLTQAAESDGGVYDPAEDGCVLLIEPGDRLEAIVQELGKPLHRLDWEGGWRGQNGCLCGLLLCNNQYGRTVMVPDAQWLDPRARRALRVAAGELKP
jgi:hypothetical protein